MNLTLFERFVSKLSLSRTTVGHYLTGIRTVERLLNARPEDFGFASLADVEGLEELRTLVARVRGDAAFRELNARGHRMYSAALTHFVAYAEGTCEGFAEALLAAEAPVRLDGGVGEAAFGGDAALPGDGAPATKPLPEKRTATRRTYVRDRILVRQAASLAGWTCERDPRHRTFRARGEAHDFMEGHHLVPLAAQPYFAVSLDVHANIVALCPTCHRLLHYGENAERAFVFDALFEAHAARLEAVGIDAPRRELRGLALR